jgi:hypothetical protein
LKKAGELHRYGWIAMTRSWIVALQELGTEPRAVVRMSLLESDVKSLEIALEDFIGAQRRPHDLPWLRWEHSFHHAKVFVVCMRRCARMLEALQAARTEYPGETQRAIDIAWKSTRAFFEPYRDARDAIEHIDGELAGKTHFMNLYDNELEVTNGVRVAVSADALAVVQAAWQRVLGSMLRRFDDYARPQLLLQLVHLLEWRQEQLSQQGMPQKEQDL